MPALFLKVKKRYGQGRSKYGKIRKMYLEGIRMRKYGAYAKGPGMTERDSVNAARDAEKQRAENEEQTQLIEHIGKSLGEIRDRLERVTVKRREIVAAEGETYILDAETVTALVINKGTYPVVVKFAGYQYRIVVYPNHLINAHMPPEIDVEGMTGITIEHGNTALTAIEQEYADVLCGVDKTPTNKTNPIDVTIVTSNRRK